MREPRPVDQPTASTLLVAGVAGGVGTSTLVRAIQQKFSIAVADSGRYQAGLVDVLVTSANAAAVARLPGCLGACPRPPVLVVMHVVPGLVPPDSRAWLAQADPFVAQRLDVGHVPHWVGHGQPPGVTLPRTLVTALDALPAAVGKSWTQPPRQPPVPALGRGPAGPMVRPPVHRLPINGVGPGRSPPR